MDQTVSTLVMLGLVSLLIILHELGHFWVAKKCGIRVERFGLGLPFGPTLWSKRIGETEYCLHAALFGGYVAFPDDTPDSTIPKDSPERFENAGWWQRFAVAIAGIAVNAVVGIALMVSVCLIWGMPGIKGVQIVDFVESMTLAADAGVQKGDVILAVDNHVLAEIPAHQRMAVVMDTIHEHASMPMEMTVSRETEADKTATVNLTVTPSAEGLLGIHLSPTGADATPYTNPITALKDSTTFLSGFVMQNFQALGGLMTGQVSGDQLSGPIRIIEQGGKVIQQQGIQNGLVIASILSVILAVMNLLPIPALDGGHILFLMIEAIKGSPVHKPTQEAVTQLGFVALLLLMGAVFANDIWQIVAPHLMG